MTIRARFPLAAAVAMAAAVLLGCEDTKLLAPTDGALSLSANPGTVVIDQDQGQTEGQSVLTAQVLDADGRALEGVAVLFSTTGGRLASRAGGNTSPVRTNADGVANDTLTLTLSDPDEVTVKATSSSLTASVTVFQSAVGPNQNPVAKIVVSPPKPTNPSQGAQAIGKPVSFDGTTSVDPDGDSITMWRWTLTSDNPDPGKPNPEILERPDIRGFDRIFNGEQELAVRLDVTDDPAAPSKFARRETVTYNGVTAAVSGYKITCDLAGPTARIAGPSPILASGAPGSTVMVTLDGTLSSDPETPQSGLEWVWTCGNGIQPVEPSPGRAECSYTVESATRTYTATLAVIDSCQNRSEDDSVQVQVSPI